MTTWSRYGLDSRVVKKGLASWMPNSLIMSRLVTKPLPCNTAQAKQQGSMYMPQQVRQCLNAASHDMCCGPLAGVCELQVLAQAACVWYSHPVESSICTLASTLHHKDGCTRCHGPDGVHGTQVQVGEAWCANSRGNSTGPAGQWKANAKQWTCAASLIKLTAYAPEHTQHKGTPGTGSTFHKHWTLCDIIAEYQR